LLRSLVVGCFPWAFAATWSCGGGSCALPRGSSALPPTGLEPGDSGGAEAGGSSAGEPIDAGTADDASSPGGDRGLVASDSGSADGGASLATGDSGASSSGAANSVGDGGCAWNLGSGTPQGTPPTQDNSADMAGAVLGTDAFDATQQRRVVGLTVTTPLPGISLGLAYLTHPVGIDDAAYLTVAVTNTGTGFPCFVQTTTFNWLNASGQVLNPMSTVYVDGSVGMLPSQVNTDSCLAPGESGYLTDVELVTGTALYSAVATIQIGLQSMGVGTTPTATFLPTRYDVGTCSGNRTLRVTGTARGGSVSVGDTGGDLAPAVFLDAAGVPVGWTLLTQMQPSNVAPGAEGYFFDELSEPAISRVQVFLSFEPPDPTIMSLPGYMIRAIQGVQAARSERARRWQTAIQRTTSR
jgi:hypothetical protein